MEWSSRVQVVIRGLSRVNQIFLKVGVLYSGFPLHVSRGVLAFSRLSYKELPHLVFLIALVNLCNKVFEAIVHVLLWSNLEDLVNAFREGFIKLEMKGTIIPACFVGLLLKLDYKGSEAFPRTHSKQY